MLINQQTAGQKTINDEDFNFPTGVYVCTLTAVDEINARADDERQTPRLVFEFTVADGPYKGKKTSTFVRKNLFAGGGARNAKPSNLYKLAKSLGCADPMAGFDTNQFMGKSYTVVVKNENTRAWPESILPLASTASATPPSANGTRSAPPPRPSSVAKPANDGAKYFVDHPKCEFDVSLGAEQVRTLIFAEGIQAKDLAICKDGDKEWKTAKEYGFEDAPIPA